MSEMRDIRRRVLAALVEPTPGGDQDYEALAQASLAAAFKRLFPDDPLEPRTDLPNSNPEETP